jgi:hypothetical protein
MTRLSHAELLCLIGAGAVGAGVHAAIAPAHLHEWMPLGVSFVAVAAVLAAAVAGLALRPDERRLVTALAALLGMVAAAYVATRLVALPPLDPEREPFDTLGACTSAIEALGVAAALHIHRPRRPRPSPTLSRGGTR